MLRHNTNDDWELCKPDSLDDKEYNTLIMRELLWIKEI